MAPTKRRAVVILKGRVVKGMGKAAMFLSIPAYKRRFKSAIGYVPYPGTLNVKLSPVSTKQVPRLTKAYHTTIKSFVLNGRGYGSVRCYAAQVNGKSGAFIIRPQKSRYPNSIIEIVARKRLKGNSIKVGSAVRLQLIL
ncbi:MAG: CTP-dependent riboflavin kinase [Candidatus Micrarchaeota archaeon]|nr:CTP-dependent riboflavin kinase [Candidatus Micrarchaeota archaeon]